MAEIVMIEGQEYKKRSPWGAWGLALITLGVYFFVWYYKVYREAKQYLRDDSISPGLMVVSLFIPIWNYITIYQLGERIGTMEQKSGLQVTVQPILGLIASIVAALHVVYYQSELNKVYDATVSGGYQSGSLPPAMPPDVPPPPPPA